MTVSTTLNKIVYQGNGSATGFAFTFPGVAAADIQVFFTDAAGNVTQLASNLFSVTLNAPIDPNPTGVGGFVTYPLVGSPIPAGTQLTILRNAPETQLTSFANQQTLYQQVIESTLDYVTLLIQQITELQNRALSVPVSDPNPTALPGAVQRANQFLGFDSSGNPIAAVAPASSGIISSAMQPVVSAATLALARTLLGLGSASTGIVNFGLQLGVVGPNLLDANNPVRNLSGNTGLAAADHMKHLAALASLSITVPKSSTLWNGFGFYVHSRNNTVTLVIDPGDAFEGGSSGAALVIPAGTDALVVGDAASSGTWYILETAAFKLNQVIVKTANYTVQLADNGNTFSLAGSTFFTVTFGAPGGYANPFGVTLVNSDNRGKLISPSGVPSFILWPGQSVTVRLNAAGVNWLVTLPGRFKPTTPSTFFVDPVLGSDSGDGLAVGSGAFLTIQHAVDNLHQNYDAGGGTPTIQLADGTYLVGSGVIVAYPLVGCNEFVIKGNALAPQNVDININVVGGVGFFVQEPATITIQDLSIRATAASAIGMWSRQFATVDFTNITFGNMSTGTLIRVEPLGSCNCIGSWNILGNFAVGIAIDHGGQASMSAFTCTLAVGLTCSFFMVLSNCSVFQGGITFAGGALTGTKYSVGSNSVLVQNGSVIPGSGAGVVATGGQVI